MTEKFQKLVDSNIQLLPLPEISTHFVFERDGFIALVERVKDTFGRIGAAGLLSDKGMAPLLWRNGSPFFVAKGFEQPATESDIERLRLFQRDLEAALS
jgi:hypothetical protein